MNYSTFNVGEEEIVTICENSEYSETEKAERDREGRIGRGGESYGFTTPEGEREPTWKYEIRVKENRFPFCIVWTPIPCLTWFLPFLGHIGICPSDGKVHDFTSSYFINIDAMAFGDPFK